MIELRTLRQCYGDHTVVDVDALTLPEGGLTSIIGPNGAGKSSLLGMIAGLQSPTQGQVVLDGQDIVRVKRDSFARRLAFLRQDNTINARLTVRDLVGFGRYPYSKGRLTDHDQRHMDHAIALVGWSLNSTAFWMNCRAASASAPLSPWFWPRTPVTRCSTNR